MKIARAFVITSLVALTGCATGYQNESFTGGFSEIQLDENAWSVVFNGNGFTSMERSVDFTYLRASELTIDAGYIYFAITYASRNVSTSYWTTPTYTTTHITFFGDTAYATSRTSGGETFAFNKPHVEMNIICFKEKPETRATVFNAVFVDRSIRAKYGMQQIVSPPSAPAPSPSASNAIKKPTEIVEDFRSGREKVFQKVKDLAKQKAIETYSFDFYWIQKEVDRSASPQNWRLVISKRSRETDILFSATELKAWQEDDILHEGDSEARINKALEEAAAF